MKKLSALLLAILFAFHFACAETAASGQTDPLDTTYFFTVPAAADTQPAPDAPLFIDLLVDADFAPSLALLGEPLSCFESESCAFQGLDKVFTFPGFCVNTYPKEGLDLIQSIYLMDDTVTTAEGAYIGMHTDELAALYGEPSAEAEGSVSFIKGGCALAFIHDADGYITAITYSSLAASAQ